MHRHLLTLAALAAFWALPVSAHGGAAPDSKAHSWPCKPARSDDRAQAPAAKSAPAPVADAPTGGFLSRGWLSFFARSSSPLLP
jgi:hypothetical protein